MKWSKFLGRRTSGFQTKYVPGDWNVECQISGFKVKASETRHRWDNIISRESFWTERHPQDFVRTTYDRQRTPWARPEVAHTYDSVTNRVTNGDFATNDLSGWKSDLNGNSGSISAATGALVFTQGAASTSMWIWQPLSLPGGYTFTLSANRTAADGGTSQVGISRTPVGNSVTAFDTDNIAEIEWLTTTTGAKTASFTTSIGSSSAAISDLFFLVILDASTATNTATIDSVSLTGTPT